MKIRSVFFKSVIIFIFTGNVHALDDLTIYAQSDGSYTYKNINYSIGDFPVNSVINDISPSENGLVVDSVIPITVDIFPVDNVGVHDLRKLVRPLAVKFHRLGAKVDTIFMNRVIPYLFKKPKFFEKSNIK